MIPRPRTHGTRRPGRRAALPLVLAGFLQAPAAAQALDIDTLSERQIAIYDISKPAEPGKTFFAATVMNAPLRQLCAIILDYPRYPQFMPNTADTRIVPAAGEQSLIDMTLALPLGKTKKYRLRMEAATGELSCRLAWKLVPSGLRLEDTIADTTGHWHLTPHPADQDKTVVEYLVHADPGPVPFGFGWIVDLMSKRSLPRTLEALRERAAALQAAAR
ncbi:MAG TPA: SRPBCC family protein [Paucimonas sp.]|nr:SRPBCC family protein [Paucimonas sp.]